MELFPGVKGLAIIPHASNELQKSVPFLTISDFSSLQQVAEKRRVTPTILHLRIHALGMEKQSKQALEVPPFLRTRSFDQLIGRLL